ncbi:uncharacterized protein BKA78DRAFT_362135 [Phyllosticta capitalensis]|uniref:uncharacterized protein n=1 Tax=Phyllosticta capitalensis TaxID=121624 RepID=UPI00312EC234
MIATLECSDRSAPGVKMRLSPFESLPTELVAAVCDHLDLSNQRELRAVSKGMQYHLDYILRDNFTHIQCRLLPVEETAMRRFRESPLAQEVRCLTWVFVVSRPIVIRTSNTTKVATNDDPARVTERHYDPVTHTQHTRAEYSGLITCAIASLPNVRQIRIVFDEPLPLISPDARDDGFISIDDLDRTFDYVCLVADKLEGHRNIKISAQCWQERIRPSATLHSKHKIASVKYDGVDRYGGLPGFPHSVTLRFCQQTGYCLNRLALDHLASEWQDIEHVAKRTGPLENLWLQNCSIQHWWLLAHGCSGIDLSQSLFPTMLRELCICDCSGFAADFPQIFKPLIQHGRLEKLQFEKIEGLWFDWNNDGSRDDGSKIPALIQDLGIGGTLAKMDECWKYKEPYWVPMVKARAADNAANR